MKLAVASLLLLSAHLVSTHTCQKGWNIFKDNCYLFVNSKANWEAAAALCKEKKAFLAVVQNSEDDKWLVAQMNEISSIKELWIGGKYFPNGNYWQWEPLGRRITYFNWAPGEPNTPTREHCLQLMSRYGHKWNDAVCSEKIPFVCEKPVLEWELFQGKNYMFFNEPQTWKEATATCAQSQAHLPVFGNPNICPWLEGHMNKHSLKHLWINGTYETNSKMERQNPKYQSCIKMNNDEGLTLENIDCLAKNEFVCERS